MGEGGGGKLMMDIEGQEEDRKRYSDSIINSPAKKKIIVAGAGTGKTFTFQELLKRKNGKALALTFISNLADDLENELKGLAESRTFHGYCKKLLHRAPLDRINARFHFFPQLPERYRRKHEKVIDILNHLKENTASIDEQNVLKKLIEFDLDEIKTQIDWIDGSKLSIEEVNKEYFE